MATAKGRQVGSAAAWAAVWALGLAGCGGERGGDAGAPSPGQGAEGAGPDDMAADPGVIGAFRVASTRYRLETEASGWSRPHLDLVVENGTPLDVTAFTVQATLVSPGRDAPWMTQTLSVPVPGAVAAGASFQITLTPSPDSPWALANATPDARMKVEVLTITSADGKVHPEAAGPPPG